MENNEIISDKDIKTLIEKKKLKQKDLQLIQDLLDLIIKKYCDGSYTERVKKCNKLPNKWRKSRKNGA